MTVYIISTEYGDWLLDETLNFITEESEGLEITMSIRMLDTSLAPAEDWEDWYLMYEDEEILNKVRPLIKRKMRTLSTVRVEH